MDAPPHEGVSQHWTVAYYRQQAQDRKSQGWRALLRPAYIAVVGRDIIGPPLLIVLFTATDYLSHATVFIQADQSSFAFTERDPSMAGGCTGCLGPCKIVMLKYKLIENVAITSAPPFFTFTSLAPNVSLYDFNSLSDEVLAFSEALDANGTLCQSSKNEWGASPIVLTGTAQELYNIIKMAKLNLSPQMVRELELAIENAEDCVTGWTIMSVVRLFQYPTIVAATVLVRFLQSHFPGLHGVSPHSRDNRFACGIEAGAENKRLRPVVRGGSRQIEAFSLQFYQ